MRSHSATCYLAFVVGLLLSAPGAWAKLEFNRDIRPILSDKCFACHGFDAKTREAGLRLDTEEGAYSLKDGVQAIKPGDLQGSEVWHRITHDDEDELMPPPESNKGLTEGEKEVLKRWIEEDGKYQPHWAFVPPKKRAPPVVSGARNPIDQFIGARLEEEELSFSPEADRTTLIRRVTLDLTGLPPTPQQLDQFLNDAAPGAYERLVDRLMATRDYAERRAQDWLDLARYADTRGFADDKMRQIWPYRDWVVRALHRNIPFDQFTIEQLAGDMLPNATDEQRIATGFHRNAPQARGNTYPVEEYRLKGVTDRVNTTGKVWLGLTMECAECHDHKFDPISQRDYFSLFAIFNNTEHRGKGHGQGGPTMTYRPPVADPDPDLLAERARLKAELISARKKLPAPKALGGEGLLGKWDAPHLESDAGKFCITGDLTITAKIRTKQAVANLVSKYDWPGKQRSYVFGIGGEGDEEGRPGHLFFWASARTDPYQGVAIHGSRAVNDDHDHDVALVFEAGKSVRLFVDGIEDAEARVLGSPPRSIAVSNRPLTIGAGYKNSSKPNAHRFEGSLTEVRLYDRALELIPESEEIRKLQSALHKIDDKQSAGSKEIPAVPVMKERRSPRQTFIHQRGSFLSPGDKVSPAAPKVLVPEGERQPGDRLEFARWLVDGKNPLVARVVVNRFWQSYFGQGLVSTSDDFGSQGAPATHPELLDWLATEFVDSGWDMKYLNRLIVTSATYRQAARISSTHRERDPNNDLLSRMPRVRLPAEQIRDQALAIGSLLKPFAGGPSVFPPQPDSYWEDRDLPGKWVASKGDNRYSKSLYTYWRRMALHPTMELLDAPARAVCVSRRNSANLPTQALVTLNAPVFVESAEGLAKRLLGEALDSKGRLDLAFRLCLGRLPSADEREKFLSFLESHSGPSDLAKWQSLSTVLLNLDETITRP
ncbi:DUF1553 domain-containing protein [Akkermansiaceae bacterium]|nr:DUF1553 domain-containing protein [Akkermansiaceae bacterium]MDB4579971.1 DUF1553 domain-containing protein [Akkermansiaceae bacterium]MDB4684029.1 DUF1553 domain-containing protein [Akkermansiaceae bacterium]